MQHIKTTFSAFLLRHGYRYNSTVHESKTRNVHMATDIYKAKPVVVYEYRDRSNTVDTSRCLWRFLHHHHVLRCMETFVGENGRDIIYITEHCGNASVSEYIKTTAYQQMSNEERERLVRKWTLQCTKALWYNKTLGLITRDFAWQDVLLDHNLDVKLGMTDTFTHVGAQQTKPWGLLAGKCPEAKRSRTRVDREKMAHAEIFLVGTALLRIFNIAEDIGNRWNELAPKIASAQGISEEGKSFLTRTLEPKWRKRMIYSEALEHPWLKLAAAEIAPKTMSEKRRHLRRPAASKVTDKGPSTGGVKSRLLGKLLETKKATDIKEVALPSTSSQRQSEKLPDVEEEVVQEKPSQDTKGAGAKGAEDAKHEVKSGTDNKTGTNNLAKAKNIISETSTATCDTSTCKSDIEKETHKEIKDDKDTKLPQERLKENKELNSDRIPTKEHVESDVAIEKSENSASTPHHALETPKSSEDTGLEELKSSAVPSNCCSSTNSDPKDAEQDDPQLRRAKSMPYPRKTIVLEEPFDTDIGKSVYTLVVTQSLETNVAIDNTENYDEDDSQSALQKSLRPSRWSRHNLDTKSYEQPWPRPK